MTREIIMAIKWRPVELGDVELDEEGVDIYETLLGDPSVLAADVDSEAKVGRRRKLITVVRLPVGISRN
jgi:hypothetical protein